MSTVKDILPKSQLANRAHGVTAFLVIHNDFFFQTLEGEHLRVNALYKNIVNDPRHYACNLIEYKILDELTFPIWDMAAATLPRKDLSVAKELLEANPKNNELVVAAKKMLALIDAELIVDRYFRDWGKS